MELEIIQWDGQSGWSGEKATSLDPKSTLVMVFGGTNFLDSPEPLRNVVQKYPGAVICGCSTSGEINQTEIHDGTLVAAVMRFSGTALRSAFAPVSKTASSYDAGVTLAQQLLDPSLKGVLVFSDGLSVNGSELVRGLNAQLPESVVVTGGLAGDGDRFQRTWVMKDGQPQSGYVTAVGLYGQSVRIGHGSKGGWDVYGPERMVTRSEGNVLFELDGKPALQLYKEYLGDRASGLPATGLHFPLALRASQSDEKYLVRTILAIDEAQQSITFAGDVPQGHFVQLMRANLDRLVTGASEAAIMTKDQSPGQGDVLALAISCVGRRLVLGERTEEEIETTLDLLPPGTRQIGFYSYGEISPYASGKCDLHNQTMTLTTISEQ